MRSLLYEVTPADPATHAAVVAGLMVVAVLACLDPAWRATLVDPVVALRKD